MAFFETAKLKDQDGNVVNPADNDSITLLRRILILLKPLGVVTGAGSSRLSVDVNSAVAVSSLPTLANVTTVAGVTTVSTVTTVGTVTNQSQIGGVNSFELLKAMSRTGYATGIRSNLLFT